MVKQLMPFANSSVFPTIGKALPDNRTEKLVKNILNLLARKEKRLLHEKLSQRKKGDEESTSIRNSFCNSQEDLMVPF